MVGLDGSIQKNDSQVALKAAAGGGGENRTLVQVPIQRTSTCVARTLIVGNRLAHGQAPYSLLCCIFAVG